MAISDDCESIILFVFIMNDCTVKITFAKPNVELGDYILRNYDELFPQERIKKFVTNYGHKFMHMADSFAVRNKDELIANLFYRDITEIVPAMYTYV